MTLQEKRISNALKAMKRAKNARFKEYWNGVAEKLLQGTVHIHG